MKTPLNLPSDEFVYPGADVPKYEVTTMVVRPEANLEDAITKALSARSLLDGDYPSNRPSYIFNTKGLTTLGTRDTAAARDEDGVLFHWRHTSTDPFAFPPGGRIEAVMFMIRHSPSLCAIVVLAIENKLANRRIILMVDQLWAQQ